MAQFLPRRMQDAEWPESHDAVRFLVRTAPDSNGRQDFYALWWQSGHRRGQFFHADLDQHVRKAKREGVEVDVVEHFGSLKAAA